MDENRIKGGCSASNLRSLPLLPLELNALPMLEKFEVFANHHIDNMNPVSQQDFSPLQKSWRLDKRGY